MSRPNLPIATPGQRIGLLGGSFNPAHDGHLEISLEAIKKLELDWVWWLVSPQNPLKDANDTQPLADRFQAAQRSASHPRIVATTLEQQLGTQYSIDTISRIKTRWPQTHFIWLMGADILPQLPRWKHWTQFMTTVPVAIFNRPGYSLNALSSIAAHRYSKQRWDEGDAAGVVTAQAPAWCFIHNCLHPQSSTALRNHK